METEGEPDGGEQPPVVETPADVETINLLDPDAQVDAFRALDHEAQEELLKDPAWKGFKVDAPVELINGLPIEAKQLLHNTRSQASRAIQAAAEERRVAAAERVALQQQRTALENERRQLRVTLGDPSLLGEAPAEEPNAETDPAGWLKWAASRYAREQIEKFQGNLVAKANAESEALQRQVEEVAVKAQQDALAAWISVTPEMKDPATVDAVEAKLKASNYGITAQDALTLVLVDRQRSQLGQERQAIIDTSRVVQRPGGGKRMGEIPPTPDTDDIATIQKFYAEYPEAKTRDAMRRRGGPNAA